MKRLQSNKILAYSIMAVLILAMVFLQVLYIDRTGLSYPTNTFVDGWTRLLGGVFFIVLLYHLGYSFLSHRDKSFKRSLIVILPALLIALNNLPLVAHLNGKTTITEPLSYIIPFALETLSIGFFEEIVFRGVILLILVERLAEEEYGILKAVVLSSFLFGAIHLLNLFAGADIMDTLLQVIYSFLMGMVWAVVYLKTRNLWLSMLLHAIYNFTGAFFVTLGTVRGRYDWMTIIVTTLFAIGAAVYYYHTVLELSNDEVECLYEYEPE